MKGVEKSKLGQLSFLVMLVCLVLVSFPTAFAVVAGNSPPVIEPVPDQQVILNQLLTFQVNATDPDGDSLIYTIDQSNLDLGMFMYFSGLFEWNPYKGTNLQGVYPVTVYVDDGQGNIATSTFNINVLDNSPPVIQPINNQTITVNSGTIVDFFANATDPDGDSIVYYINSGEITATIDQTTGEFIWDTTGFAPGIYPFSVGVADLINVDALTDFNITIIPNLPPTIDPIPNQTVAIEHILNLENIAATDPNGDALNFSLDSTSITLGMYLDNTGFFQFAPALGVISIGVYPITITVDDGFGNTASTSFTVNVVANSPPVIQPIPDKTVATESVLNFTVVATDADGDVINYYFDSASEALGMFVDPIPGDFQWPTSGVSVGSYPVTLTAYDSYGGTTDATFTINVVPNSPPTVDAISNQTILMENTLNLQVNATDVDGDPLYYLIDDVSIALGMSIDSATGVFTWTPSAAAGNTTGAYTVTVMVDDYINPVVTTSFTVNAVLDVTPPTITAPVDINAEATGVTTIVSLGTPIVSDNVDPSPVVSNDAPAEFPLGVTVVVWTATDASGYSSTATQNVTVIDTTPPIISVQADINVMTIDLNGMIVDYNFPLTQDLVDGNGTASCTPTPGSKFALGTNTVTCTATDIAGNTSTSTFNINVQLMGFPITTASAGTYVFGTWTNDRNVTVTLSCSDTNGVGCDTIMYCTDLSNNCTPTTVYTVPVFIDTTGISYIRFDSNDVLGNFESMVNSKTIKIADINHVVPDTNEFFCDENTSRIVTQSGSPLREVHCLGDISETKEISIDESELMDSNGNVVQTNDLELERETSDGNIEVKIPAGTIISGEAGWDGLINIPTIKSTSSITVIPDSGMSATVVKVFEIGSMNKTITFDKGVRIVIPGQAGKSVGYSIGGVFHAITNTCSADTQAVGDALAQGSECKINSGNNLVIWTKHFTTFAAYTQTANSTGGSGGSTSSGGSGGVAGAPLRTTVAPTTTLPSSSVTDNTSDNTVSTTPIPVSNQTDTTATGSNVAISSSQPALDSMDDAAPTGLFALAADNSIALSLVIIVVVVIAIALAMSMTRQRKKLQAQ